MEKVKRAISHIKVRVLIGLIALVPIFAIISILIELWKKLTGAADIMVKTFGFSTLLGMHTVKFFTSLLLVLVFYAFGWLVNFRFFQNLRNWIEKNALQYLPGYLTYKAKMEEKLSPTKETKQPVLVQTPMGQRPALLVTSAHGKNTVFLPNCPDSNNGVVWIVDDAMVTTLNLTYDEFLESLQRYGTGITGQ